MRTLTIVILFVAAAIYLAVGLRSAEALYFWISAGFSVAALFGLASIRLGRR